MINRQFLFFFKTSIDVSASNKPFEVNSLYKTHPALKTSTLQSQVI
ncbi:unnamed protein product [Paramecium sonneborni]|uniref:Uncharacterized protein n=1 Tax=Paramecium sonneborni TaxID=65129 RepID=A0A8S1KJN0_9CILI|nr:unnamed protein product [Paramecium sonneborni]